MFELLDEELSSASTDSTAPLGDDLFTVSPPHRTPRRVGTSTPDVPRLLVFPGAKAGDDAPLPPCTLKQAGADIKHTLFEALRCFGPIAESVPILLVGVLTFAWLCSEPTGVAQGVKVNGQNMGGLSQGELRDAVTALAREKANTPVTLVFDGADGSATEQRLTVKPKELAIWEKSPLPTAPYTNVPEVVAHAYLYGRELNLAQRFGSRQPYRARAKSQFHLRPLIDEDRMKRQLRKLKKIPIDASLVWTGTKAVVKKEVYGLEVDPAAALKQIETGLSNDQTTIRVSARPVAPRVVATDLAKFATESSAIVPITASNPNAKVNAEIAALTLQSVTMRPGETISLNSIIGERKESKGYKKASAFVNGDTVQDFGAGICYVSTAAYQAAMASKYLKVVEHHVHSQQVSYAAKGRDATLAWGFKDLKLKNTSKKPVVLMMAVEGKRVTARILSAPAG